ncbi:MAG: hypothetical protein Q8S73_20125, partial [Deltaproteobacteria bacterium]|nr:hypothetical protein [Deltaproteobacteria bacterium]
MRRALLIVGLLAACSSSIPSVPLDGGRADAPTPAATDPIPLEALGSELSRALCAALFRCSLGTRELREVRLQITDEASCVRLMLPRAVDQFRDLIVATNAGLTRYDAAAARRCITGLGSRCDLEFESSVEVCPGLFSGTVPTNGSCWRTEECAGDAWCRHGGTLREPRLCPGTCLPRVAPGGMCRQREECSSVGSATRVLCSLVVAPGEEGGRCVAIASAPPGADGDGCGLATAATNPPVDRRCATGLACAPTAGRSQCRPKLAAGAPCGGGDACADGTQCLPVGDGTTGACSPLQRWREGEACPEGQLGRTGLCDAAARLQCEDGFCRAAPGDGGIGSGCGTIPCNAGLYCD